MLLLWHGTRAQGPEVVNPREFSKLEWLEGSWSRKDMKPGKRAFERWEQTAEGEYTGLGITMQGGDTTFVEKLRIIIKDDAIYYEADVPENQQPVSFKFTKLTGSAFECENPSHDFPKKISYSLTGRLLTARISGNGQEIKFLFERKSP